jgi:ABC-2 type transport system permease protein
MCFLVQACGRRVFFAGWLRTQQVGRRSVQPVLFRALDRLLAGLPSDVRALVVKDVRTFFRDPMQWSQAVVFFGLLALYFISMRSFSYHQLPDVWRNIIAFLNVFSVSAVLCSLGSRFIYPQLSLEGHGYWVLGLAPTTPGRILLTKFGSAVLGMLAVSVGLMWLSTAMLSLEATVRWVAVAVAAAVSVAVSGLSTGLGAIYLNLLQRNPAAIVSGFGGTLNLVLSLSFMFGAILPFAAAFHLFFLDRLGSGVLRAWLVAATVWLLVLTVVATVVPLRLGWRSLQRRDL